MLSHFLGALGGYALGTLIGVVIVIAMTISAGTASAVGGLKMLTGAGAVGAFLGHFLTTKLRQSKGVTSPQDDPAKFLGSLAGFGMAMIVIAGSFGFAVLIKVVYDSMAA